MVFEPLLAQKGGTCFVAVRKRLGSDGLFILEADVSAGLVELVHLELGVGFTGGALGDDLERGSLLERLHSCGLLDRLALIGLGPAVGAARVHKLSTA